MQCGSCVYLAEIFVMFVVEHPLKVDSHKSSTTFTSKHCWVGVILAVTNVLATTGGCRLSAIIGFVSVTSTESYILGYYGRRGHGDIASSVPEVWQCSIWRSLTEKATISLGNAPPMRNALLASYVHVLHDGQ